MVDGTKQVEQSPTENPEELPKWITETIPEDLNSNIKIPEWLKDPQGNNPFRNKLTDEQRENLPEQAEIYDIAADIYDSFNRTDGTFIDLQRGLSTLISKYEGENNIQNHEYTPYDQQIWGGAITKIQHFYNQRIEKTFPRPEDKSFKEKYLATIISHIDETHPGLISAKDKLQTSPLQALIESGNGHGRPQEGEK